MELNTKSYIKYKSKIDEYWQDQVFAGGMWGRANLREVGESFAKLKVKIINDADLSQEHKNELLGIIVEKMEVLKIREEEILKAEDTFTPEKVCAMTKAVERLKKMPNNQQEKYGLLRSILLDRGYDIFLTVEEMNQIFKGEEEYSSMKDRLKKDFPTISMDLVPKIEKTEERLNPVKEEK